MAAISRAIWYMLLQSARFGNTLTSKITSSKPNTFAIGIPTGVDGSNISKPYTEAPG